MSDDTSLPTKDKRTEVDGLKGTGDTPAGSAITSRQDQSTFKSARESGNGPLHPMFPEAVFKDETRKQPEGKSEGDPLDKQSLSADQLAEAIKGEFKTALDRNNKFTFSPELMTKLGEAFDKSEDPKTLQKQLNDALKGSSLHIGYEHRLTYASPENCHNLGDFDQKKTRQVRNNFGSPEPDSQANGIADIINNSYKPTQNGGRDYHLSKADVATINEAFENTKDARRLELLVNQRLPHIKLGKDGEVKEVGQPYLLYKHQVGITRGGDPTWISLTKIKE